MVKLFHMWLESLRYKKYKEMQVPTKVRSMKKKKQTATAPWLSFKDF